MQLQQGLPLSTGLIPILAWFQLLSGSLSLTTKAPVSGPVVVLAALAAVAFGDTRSPLQLF